MIAPLFIRLTRGVNYLADGVGLEPTYSPLTAEPASPGTVPINCLAQGSLYISLTQELLVT